MKGAVADASVLPMLWDATDRVGQSGIPQGLSVVQSVPVKVGEKPAEVELLAALWADGSTFGDAESLAVITSARQAKAQAFRRIRSILQDGLQKGWGLDEYLKALGTPNPDRKLSPEMQRATMTPLLAVRSMLGGHAIVDRNHPVGYLVQRAMEVCDKQIALLEPFQSTCAK